jgi:hypothetical protein
MPNSGQSVRQRSGQEPDEPHGTLHSERAEAACDGMVNKPSSVALDRGRLGKTSSIGQPALHTIMRSRQQGVRGGRARGPWDTRWAVERVTERALHACRSQRLFHELSAVSFSFDPYWGLSSISWRQTIVPGARLGLHVLKPRAVVNGMPPPHAHVWAGD